MIYDPKRHHRRSIRLRGYDYTQAGAYYVTIVCQDRACLFGEIVDGTMQLNDAGRMVQRVWDEIPLYYPGVDVDACCIMPNHLHGVVVLFVPDIRTVDDVGAGPRTCPDPHAPPPPGQPTPGQPTPGQPQGVAPTMRFSLPDVVHRFKTMTTKRYTDGVKQLGWLPYNGRVWQRNYFEHIVRNERTLQRIRDYIDANPAMWADDPENPAVIDRNAKR